VHRDKHFRRAIRGRVRKAACDLTMIRNEDPRDAPVALRIADPDIGRYRSTIRNGRDNVRRGPAAIALNDEARVALEDERRANQIGKLLRNGQDADIDPDVPIEISVRDSKPAEGSRDRVAGVVADNEEG
jgi:hypothetical protein